MLKRDKLGRFAKIKLDEEKITDHKYQLEFGDKEEKILKLGRKIVKLCR